MTNIRKRGQSFQAQVRPSGGRTASATFKTQVAAQNWVREQAFLLGQPPKNRDERITLRDIIERFITDVIPLSNSGESEELRLHRVCGRPIASKRLAEITNSDLCHYRNQRLR